MAKLQLYENDKDARLFDGSLVVTFIYGDNRCNVRLSKRTITRILNRMGYIRKSKWVQADWGWESTFVRK